MLEDHAGKAVKKTVRQQVLPYAEDFMLPTQQGGLPHRGTDIAAHILRLFVEDCH